MNSHLVTAGRVLVLCSLLPLIGSCQKLPTIPETHVINDPSPCNPHGVIPTTYFLYAYPNPFEGKTAIALDLPVESHVQMVVRNPTGDVVRVLINERACPGTVYGHWIGDNDKGQQVNDGVYLVTVIAGLYEASTTVRRHHQEFP